ncbi:MAG: hypothetical protein D6753_18625 [Planctomycetota bacterium]|nr:MAG: hypothetical protein D6753_18625 [Planctomycetota bacterium]
MVVCGSQYVVAACNAQHGRADAIMLRRAGWRWQPPSRRRPRTRRVRGVGRDERGDGKPTRRSMLGRRAEVWHGNLQRKMADRNRSCKGVWFFGV